MQDGSTWGTAGEKGMSAAYAMFLVAGIVVEWALNRWFGECPDEVSGLLHFVLFLLIGEIKKWDSYLANYTAALPDQANRAGTFQPLTLLWDRIFPPSSLQVPSASPSYKGRISSKEDIFSSDKPISSPAVTHNLALQSHEDLKKARFLSSLQDVLPTTVDIFKKTRSTKPQGFTKWKKNKALGLSETRRKPIKFGAVDDLSSGSDSSDYSESEYDKLGAKEGSKQKQKLPWNSGSYSSSTPTLVEARVGKGAPGPRTLDHDIDSDIKKLKIQKQQKDADTLDYSDYEEDLSSAYHPGDRAHQTATSTKDQDWQPGFLKRHHPRQLPTPEGHHLFQSVKPVPATPSLIKALDRIAVAQRDAFGPPVEIVGGGLPPPNLANVNAADSPKREREIKSGGKRRRPSQERAPRWDDFWREVQVKAQTRG